MTITLLLFHTSNILVGQVNQFEKVYFPEKSYVGKLKLVVRDNEKAD